MSNNYNEMGNRIQESVAEALKTGDFGKLNQEINSSVISVLNDVGDQINSAVSEAKQSARGMDAIDRGFTNSHQKGYEVKPNLRNSTVKKPLKRIKFVEKGGMAGGMQIFWGIISFFYGVASTISMGNPLFLPLVVLGIVLGLVGGNNIKWLNLAKRYKKLCSEKQYIEIDAIANTTGVSQKKAIKNVKKILSRGYFPEGFMDEECTTFMVSKELYDQYIATKKSHMEELKREQEANANGELTNAQEAALNAMISEGIGYIGRLHALNEKIPGVVITQKLNQLEKLLNEIFNGVNEHPDQMGNCRKLMEYYLPTMIKLVEAYAEYDKVSQPGEEIITAKNEIENTLDIINQAFVELLNKLYQNSTWDVTAEAKVLKTMLHQDGLTDNELTQPEFVDQGIEFPGYETLEQTSNK